MSGPSSLLGPALPEPKFPTVTQALTAAAAHPYGLRLVDVREQEQLLLFAEVYSRARRMAARLMELGIAPGDRVAIVLPTGRDFMDAFFGAQLAGAVPVPLYPPVRLGRMDEYTRATARMLTVVGARIVLSDRRIRLMLGTALEVARPALGCPTVADLMDGSNEAERPVGVDALGLIQFSSGSTVDPKPVALTHRNLLTQVSAIKAQLPTLPGTQEKGCSWLPLYHDMGLIGCLMLAVYWPGELVLLPPEGFLAKPALWLRAIARHRATLSVAPNFAYGLCLKRIDDEDLKGADLSSWSYALNGAEPVSAQVMERFCQKFEKYGFRRSAMMPVYGLSEASLAVTFTTPSQGVRVAQVDGEALARSREVRPGGRAIVSVGTPVPGCEVEVRAEDGAVVPQGAVGRVFARGPFMMREYYGQPEATARALRDGWLDTGDLGFVDEGELFICGRAKDLVIIRGANHPPQAFEECLEGLAGVRAGCAVALGFVPDDTQEESLLVLAELGESSPADLAAQISSAIVARTNVRPHTVLLLAPGTLPRTSSGKLRRAEALRQFLAGELTAPKKVNALTMGLEMAKSALAHARRSLPASGDER